MENTFIISRKARRIIDEIFEHDNEVYSIYFKDERDVVWIHGKINLYNYLNNL